MPTTICAFVSVANCAYQHHDLAKLPNVIATPHIAGLTPQAIEHQALETVQQVGFIIKGEAPVGAVNAEHWTRRP